MLALLTFIAAPLFVSALHLEPNPGRRHANMTRSLEKRGQEFSFYEGGQVACGGSVSASDTNTVAISAQIWDGGSHCGQQITIHAYGKTRTATVRDECMGCHPGKVDLIEGLFAWFTGGPTLEVGIFPGSWSFGDGDAEEKEKEKAKKEKEEKEKQQEEEEKKKKEEAAASSSSAAAAKSSSSAAAAKSSSLAAAKLSSLAAATSSSSVAAQSTATTDATASKTAGASSVKPSAGTDVISNANQLFIGMASMAVTGH